MTSGDTHHYTKEDWLLGHVLIGFLYLWRGNEAGTAGRRLPAAPHNTWNTLFPMSPSAPSQSQHVSQVCKTGYKANSLGSAPCSATALPWDRSLPCLWMCQLQFFPLGSWWQMWEAECERQCSACRECPVNAGRGHSFLWSLGSKEAFALFLSSWQCGEREMWLLRIPLSLLRLSEPSFQKELTSSVEASGGILAMPFPGLWPWVSLISAFVFHLLGSVGILAFPPCGLKGPERAYVWCVSSSAQHCPGSITLDTVLREQSLLSCDELRGLPQGNPALGFPLSQACMQPKTMVRKPRGRLTVGAVFLESLLLCWDEKGLQALGARKVTGFIFVIAICLLRVKRACYLQWQDYFSV